MTRRGRKRKPGVPRTPSGQISRAQRAQIDEAAEARAVRIRMFGLSEVDARDQKAATYIGRLCLAGRKNTTDSITETQYEAAQRYLNAYIAFQRAVGSPDSLREGRGGGTTIEDDAYNHRCQAAVALWERLQACIYREQEIHRHANMWAALDYLVLRDQAFPHMLGDLRLALNAVIHELGITTEYRKAS